jgi:hypothetical protein
MREPSFVRHQLGALQTLFESACALIPLDADIDREHGHPRSYALQSEGFESAWYLRHHLGFHPLVSYLVHILQTVNGARSILCRVLPGLDRRRRACQFPRIVKVVPGCVAGICVRMSCATGGCMLFHGVGVNASQY